MYKNKEIELEYISTDDMLADVLTKYTSGTKIDNYSDNDNDINVNNCSDSNNNIIFSNIDHSLSTVNHPQTDGQTERVNGIFEHYHFSSLIMVLTLFFNPEIPITVTPDDAEKRIIFVNEKTSNLLKRNLDNVKGSSEQITKTIHKRTKKQEHTKEN
ncbi:hypothetical protein PIROE2DRAFT_1747 [Piromyces sp. E2]|nr:hypothetical protein PIROE2DRAFT_1747 [Piromyces sp. E2]|eukprot:OUM70071.1 hypothetical protein PIROE2DRAFT_1747 [Piromyces sp. E2]